MKISFSKKLIYDLMHGISSYLDMLNLKKKIQFYEGMLTEAICSEDYDS